jgi:4-alpha-glucanotransferase
VSTPGPAAAFDGAAFRARSAGVLLHPTSLPGPGRNGRLDAAAYRFVDWLAAAGFRWWQMLPIGPVDEADCPYQPPSTCAGGTHLLDPAECPEPPADALAAFVEAERDWLEDWALFAALRAAIGRPWPEWPAGVRHRAADALADARAELAPAIDEEKVAQWHFARQWRRLRTYAHERGVALFGDVPIYCALDSADVWAEPHLFAVDGDGTVTGEAGVPPDAFSDTGQHWGQPLHEWAAHAADRWRWWCRRMRVQAGCFDLLRIDHFRGFAAAWSIPAGAIDARDGDWVVGPGRAPFDAIRADLGHLPLVAEDLGMITEDVHALRDALGLPGMRVLQFAFDDGPENPHRPRNHPEWSIAYTGTHDNDTALGWWQKLDEGARDAARGELGTTGETMPAPLVDAALGSRARVAILPLQDVLELGSEARMNVPGRREDNWSWRFGPGDLVMTDTAAWRARLARFGRVG